MPHPSTILRCKQFGRYDNRSDRPDAESHQALSFPHDES